MPTNAKNASRREQATKAAAAAKSQSDAIAKMASAMTEEEKMMAMFAAQGAEWTAQQEEMSHQTPVYKPGSKKPANVPDHEPPNGYVCHRCGEKGHWIQQCPTNDNPEYDNRPRVKRTTGIPKSFLKTVDKATVLAQGADGDDSKTPAGIMVNADGEFVIAEPDKASWQKFQAKAQGSAEAKKIAAQGEKELQERGLECDIDNKMFIDPMKTPCCAKTYCNDCITNALIEGDLVCPSCQTEGVLIDDLKPDEEATAKIEEYLKEKEQAKKERSKTPEAAKSPAADESKEVKKSDEPVDGADGTAKVKTKSPTPPPSVKSPTGDASSKSTPVKNEDSPAANGSQPNSKKRPADEPAGNQPDIKIPKGPKAMIQKQQQTQQPRQQMNGMMPDFMGMNGMNGFPPMGMPMGMNGMNGFPSMGMPMGMMNGFNMNNFNPMMNPMMMNGGFPGNNGFGMNGGGFPTGPSAMNGGAPNQFNGPMNGGAGPANGGGPGFNRGGPPTGPRQPNFSQAATTTTTNNNNNNNSSSNDEDAYFRKPVNPHRHQNRQRRVRPSDYREL
jgi:protein MPE1